MASNISPKIGLEGEKEFSNAIKNINQSLKTLDSEMKIVTSEFAGQEKSMASLTKANDVYERQLYTLNDKLEMQGKRLKEAAKEWGEADIRTQKLQEDYNKTQAQINKVNNKIQENNKAMKDHSAILDKAKKSVVAFGAAAATAFTAAIAAVGKLGKALGSMAMQAANAGDELETMSAKTGLSTNELQRYAYAAGVIDVSVETISGSMTKLIRSMNSASKGSGSAAAAFAKLGVTVTKSNGELRDRTEVFNELVIALGKIENETERDAIAMEVFGKSAQELNPLILGGADALKALGEEAERAGLILSESQLSNLTALSDSVDRLKATVEGARNLFVSTFSGEIAAGINTITGYIQRLTAAFSEGGLEATMAELPNVVDELAANIEAKLPIIINVGSEILTALATGFQAVVPLLLPAAAEALTAIANSLIEPANLELILQSAGTIVVTLVEGIVANIPMIVQTAFKLIGDLVAGLFRGIYEMIPASGRALIDNFISGISSMWSNIKGTARNIISTMTSGIKESLSEAFTWGRDLIQGFTDGIKAKWGKLKEVCSQTASKIRNFLGFSVPKEGPLSDADTYGPDFMMLYAQGIRDNQYRVTNAAEDVARAMSLAVAPDLTNAEMLANAQMGMQEIMADNRSMLENLAIYLDSGLLVGGIARKMNNQLGRAYVQDVRGSMP